MCLFVCMPRIYFSLDPDLRNLIQNISRHFRSTVLQYLFLISINVFIDIISLFFFGITIWIHFSFLFLYICVSNYLIFFSRYKTREIKSFCLVCLGDLANFSGKTKYFFKLFFSPIWILEGGDGDREK